MIQEGHYQELSYLMDKVNNSCKCIVNEAYSDFKTIKNKSTTVNPIYWSRMLILSTNPITVNPIYWSRAHWLIKPSLVFDIAYK